MKIAEKVISEGCNVINISIVVSSHFWEVRHEHNFGFYRQVYEKDTATFCTIDLFLFLIIYYRNFKGLMTKLSHWE